MTRHVSRRRGGRLWCFAASLGLSACALNPATGERQLTLISEAQEVQMGREAARQVEQTIGLVDNGRLQAYIADLGGRLAQASERPKLPWSFQVVDDPTPNAFALPGGPIFITRGMMSLMDSEAELASVLGHEIGHITARHSVAMMSRQQLAQLGLGLGGLIYPEIRPFGQALNVGLDVLFLKYGRDAERQADELGFRYAGRENYDLESMADVFASLQRIGELEERSALPSWLATHPDPADRIEHVREMLAATPRSGGRVARAEYLNQIDGLVYGQNPRHGFFRDGRFLHPELRFQFAIPSKWEAQNLARAVVAIDPRRTAVVQLTLAGDVRLEEASRRFLEQPGMSVRSSSRSSVNGIAAIVSAFDVRTEDGPMRGTVAHLDYRGTTYQLLGYSSAAAFGAHAQTFDSVIGSFAPLTDPEVLGVQPKRVEIVRLDRAMTLAQFNETHASTVPLNVLAILNQVADGQSRLEAGTMVKRVVG